MNGQRKAPRDGIALIAVLWVVAFMTTLLVVTLTVLKMDVDDNVAEVHSFRAWQLAHTGLSYGVHPQMKRDDPLLQSQEGDFDEGYEVTVSPEAARLNINTVLAPNNRNLLINLFKKWGVEEQETYLLVDALVDWVDQDELRSANGAEYDFYREQGYLDRPYNRQFRDLDEVPLVRGFSQLELLKPDWRDFLTIWSNGKLDIHEAHPELLAVAADIDDTAAQDFHQNVLGDDGIMGTEDDVRFSSVEEALNALASPPASRQMVSQRFTLKGKVLRVESVGRSGNFRYLIRAISASNSGQVTLLDYQEQQLGSE